MRLDGGRTRRVSVFTAYPSDQIHLDFTQLHGVLGKFGDGAVAFGLAHQTGHHIQNLLDVCRANLNVELQADCFAGLYMRFGYSKSGKVSWSDYQEARNQLWALGSSQSHGTNAQRLAALDYGFKTFTLELLPERVLERGARKLPTRAARRRRRAALHEQRDSASA